MAVPQGIPNPLIHQVQITPKNPENEGGKTKLEEILKQKENQAAIRYSAAELEKMAIQAENEVARMTRYPEQGGGRAMQNEEELAKMRQQIADNAVNLLRSGVDPKIVGQFLLGSTQAIPITVPTGGGQGGTVVRGYTFEDTMAIVDRILGAKAESELKTMITNTQAKVEEFRKELEKGGGGRGELLDPATVAKKAAEITRATYDAWKAMGLIQEPVTPEGKTLEQLKEDHRHSEKMEEIKADREYRQGLVKTASEIPERIGRSIGAQMREETGTGGPGSASKLSQFTCDDCGATVFAPPNATEVKCGKCGTIYARTEKKAEEAQS